MSYSVVKIYKYHFVDEFRLRSKKDHSSPETYDISIFRSGGVYWDIVYLWRTDEL